MGNQSCCSKVCDTGKYELNYQKPQTMNINMQIDLLEKEIARYQEN